MYRATLISNYLINYTPILKDEDINKYLEKVIPHTGGRYYKEDIIVALHSDAMHLWIAFDGDNEKIDGIVVTHFTVYPRKKALTILLCAGEKLNNWYDVMLKQLEEFSKVNSCTLISSGGRKGWVRRMKKDGFKQSFFIAEKELIGGSHG